MPSVPAKARALYKMKSWQFDANEDTGDFCVAGRCILPNPGLVIERLGMLSLPFRSSMLSQIEQNKIPQHSIPDACARELEFDHYVVSLSNGF